MFLYSKSLQILHMNKRVQRYFKEGVQSIQKINHMGNNRLFEVLVNNNKYLLKEYSIIQKNWDRGKTEFEAVKYLNQKRFGEVPMCINYYPEDNIGIYSFEEGRVLNIKDVNSDHISLGVDFITKLHKINDEDKRGFKPERTARFSLISYVELLENRLESIEKNFYGSSDNKYFLNNLVKEKINELKSNVLPYGEIYINRKLRLNEQVLTSGDFGFHNMLYNGKKSKFIDFEYFGRDDPVKEILNFLHHDKNTDLDRKLKEQFLEEYKKIINVDQFFEERLTLADPLIGMNWVLIGCGFLNNDYYQHMKFSYGDNLEELLENRIKKAKNKLNNLKFFS